MDFGERFCLHFQSLFTIIGLDAPKGGRRHENITLEEEIKFLEPFKEKAEKGQLVDANEMRSKYEELIGRETNPGQIYKILERHGWVKKCREAVTPRKQARRR